MRAAAGNRQLDFRPRTEPGGTAQCVDQRRHDGLPDGQEDTGEQIYEYLGVAVTPNFGLRFEAKARTTYINSEDDHWYCDDWCDGDYYGDSQWYTSGEATAGLP